jgi:hypothetical protein
MIRITITRAAFDAIAATRALGSFAYEAEPNERGERLVWLEDAMANRLGAMRGPGESYSDVILRIAGPGTEPVAESAQQTAAGSPRRPSAII